MRRHVSPGRDKRTPRQPGTDADRLRAHGPLQPADDGWMTTSPRGTIRSVLLIVALFAVGLLACEAVVGMIRGAGA